VSTSDARRVLADVAKDALPLSGSQWEARVLAWARAAGWVCYHTGNSRGSVAGYPDFTAVHPGWRRCIWIECKAGNGRLTPAQIAWRDLLVTAGFEWYEARPEREAEILAILAGRPADTGGAGGQR